MGHRMNILFVCTGNTCRSPMAEHLLKKKFEADPYESLVQVRSAGISAMQAAAASAHAIEVLKQRNIRLDSHQSTPVDARLVEWADMILTMTMSHKHILVSQYPESSGKAFALLEYIQEDPQQMPANGWSMDVSDPYGGDRERYEACADQLERAIERLYVKIQEQLHRSS
ncbi:low molecular weight protein arginine phosphatase [Fodinisporobacter ferrooxydans]|uniref:Low molecular weight protein arginine phosphatase n=1 Tax=Fodinisporobacter ferrooxydans TaxID=2901836 RepID=A0ABY4CQ87_9BACL|nr:low molecular weight protein arginine phosphatase [Alicyclobacillaceae bacterium MYW30-H2]